MGVSVKNNDQTAPTLDSLVSIPCMVMLAACGSGGGSESPASAPVPGCNSATEFCGTIPQSANACTDNQYWPLSIDSVLRPITVHYSRKSEEQSANEIVSYLETSWDIQVGVLGFSPPLDDKGLCGSNGSYDVFIWRGMEGAFVEAISENPQTPYDDYLTYMAIDISGSSGGALLDTTVAHEFNHALQASDDWWESALVFEMCATFVEALVYPQQDDYFFTLIDFQLHPDWSLFYVDNYRTWYMYGAAMYLHFLSEKYYSGDPGFIARIWRMSRSDPSGGGPDFLDALRSMLLGERGISVDETVVEFMQWRWFIAGLDDGTHFAHGADWPAAVIFTDIDASAPQTTVDLSAMPYGAVYLRLVNDESQRRPVQVSLQFGDTDITWALTNVNGDAVAGSVTVPANANITLVATVLPTSPVSTESIEFSARAASLTLSAL